MYAIGILSAVSIGERREAEKGAGDNVPSQGLGDEIPRRAWAAAQRTPIAERSSSGIGAEPLGDNYDSDILR